MDNNLPADDNQKPIIPIESGIDKLHTENYLSIPLSIEFAIGLSPTRSKNLIIWYMNTAIGTVDEFHTKINLQESIFHQELLDYISKTHTKYEVNF
mgnify:CR=1 FL=1